MFKVTVVYFIQTDISNDISTVMIFRIVKLLKVAAKQIRKMNATGNDEQEIAEKRREEERAEIKLNILKRRAVQ